MCVTPITVPNPSRRFTDGLSRTLIQVRCGKCCECQKQNEDDWYVRAHFEWMRIRKACKELGIPEDDYTTPQPAVWFVLLTYDDEHMPTVSLPDQDWEIPCFEPSHLKHFRDTLRVLLKRDGYDNLGIKFKICSEYGDVTGRPHYHCLIYCPTPLPRSYVMGKWKKVNGTKKLVGGLFQRAWPYGFVSWSRDKKTRRLRPIIETDGGIQYTMKYINKEQKWYKIYRIDELLDLLKGYVKSKALVDASDHIRAEEMLRQFKRVMPRHFTSIGFGEDLIDVFRKNDGTFDIERLVDGHIDLSQYGRKGLSRVNWNYTIPLYVMRKICYDCVDGLWTRNNIGMSVALKRHELSKKYAKERLIPYFSENTAMLHLGFLEPQLKRKLGIDIRDSVKQINDLMRGRSLDDLVMYSTVYAGVPLAYDLSDDGVMWLNYDERERSNDLCDYDMRDIYHNTARYLTHDMDDVQMMSFFREHELDIFRQQLCPDRAPDPKNYAPCKLPDFCKHRTTYGDFSCFEGFDEILKIIDNWEYALGELSNEGFKFQNERKKHLVNDILRLQPWYTEGEL